MAFEVQATGDKGWQAHTLLSMSSINKAAQVYRHPLAKVSDSKPEPTKSKTVTCQLYTTKGGSVNGSY